MKLRASIFWAAVCVMLAAIGFDMLVRARVQRLQAAAESLQAHYETLTREIQAEGRKAAALMRLNARPEQAPTAEAQPRRSDTAGQPGGGAVIDPRQVIAVNPELRAQYLQLFRDGLMTRWGLLFQMLNLPSDETEKFKDFLAQQVANRLQVYEVAASRGIDPNAPEMQALASQLNRQNAGDIAALLGPDNYAAYQQYQKESGILPDIVNLAGSLTTAPLTTDQAVRLFHVLATASEKNPGGFAINGTLNFDQAMSKAGAILNSEQLSTLDALLRQDQADEQLKKLSTSP